jgi:hypothetical protein
MSSNITTTGLANIGNNLLNSYYNNIQDTVSLQNISLTELEIKNQDLLKKKQIQINQMKEIQDKEKLLLTRSRMLQISQDRNSYKKKIIYSLIALIFIIFILTLVMYVFFVRKIAMAPKINK